MEKPYYNNNYITIGEAVKISGKSISSLYRLIKSGKLTSSKVEINGKQVITIKREDLARILPNSSNQSVISDNQSDIHAVISDNQSSNHMEISEKVLQVMEEFFDRKQAEILKPMEQQALYLAGSLSKENQFLKERLETVLNEYKELQDKMKALPDLQKEKEDIEVRLLQEKAEAEARIKTEKEEAKKQKEKLEAKIKQEAEEKAMAKAEAEEALKQLKELPAPVESIQQILLDNANNIKALAKEKDNFQSVAKENEATIKEKERALKELEELHRQELEKLKQEHEKKLKLMSDSAEKEKIEIVEAWKKKTEELERPWWKFW